MEAIIRTKCDTCDGRGRYPIGDAGAGCMIDHKCEDCSGTGLDACLDCDAWPCICLPAEAYSPDDFADNFFTRGI